MKLVQAMMNIFFPSKEKYFNINTIPTAPKITNINNALSIFDYQSKKGKELIYYIKKFHDPILIDSIAEKMYENIIEELSEQQQFGYFEKPIILSVPSTKKRILERGFDHVEYLSKTIARLTKGSHGKNLIQKIKETPKQALIRQKDKRFNNIKNAFDIKKNKRHIIENQDIIIVDDLITTGATVLEISRILDKYKVRNIIVVSIAH